MASNLIYVVTAYRWGLRDNHSYVVGAYLDKKLAKIVAREHVGYRGNKYGCEVIECNAECKIEFEEGNANEKAVFYEECPNWGNGVGMPSRTPVDHEKWLKIHEIYEKVIQRKK